AEQDPAVERARLVDKPRGFLHFFNHTPNETARPLHTKIGRAGKVLAARSAGWLKTRKPAAWNATGFGGDPGRT
ncbi:hypothetical protein, partial [Bifidobacterium moraviense]|uniref:hypothetical protein n=1 Tax=Bifidobacterium moraviense TaxID=2675323 RepID=UPI00197C06DA